METVIMMLLLSEQPQFTHPYEWGDVKLLVQVKYLASFNGGRKIFSITE